ncbi:MAG: hypothetical protein ABI776_15230 [Nocardioidaceae bacterium]
MVFQASPGMDPAGPSNYRLLAAMLADGLASTADPAARAVELGRQWGGGLVERPPTSPLSANQAVARLTRLLDELGFSPERRSVDGRKQIALRHCPFHELIDARADVICPLHLGLMQGAMQKLDASITVESLEPFAETDLCLAKMSSPGSTP